MATTKEMLDEAELAKSYVAGSDMSDDSKRTYLRLINITTEATNGISPEQKIQKMTEAILLLAVSQVKNTVCLDEKISRAVQQANSRQCETCKAMKHANDIEEREEREKLISEWKAANGYADRDDSFGMSWSDVIKTVLTKPYFYVLLGLALISPYGVQIVDRIVQIYTK